MLRGWTSLAGLGRRTELGVWAVVVGLLAVVAFGAVAGPRWMRDSEAASLRQAMERAPIGARQLAVRVIDDYAAGRADDPLVEQRERLAGIEADIDPVLLDRYGPERFVADSSRFVVAYEAVLPIPPDPDADPDVDPDLARVVPALPTFITFRVHPELDEYSELVAGRRAAPTERTVNGLAVMEFELSPESADELGWELGELIELTFDPSDVVTRSFNGGLPDDIVGELVGLRELDDVEDRYWFGDPRLHRPTVADTGLGANVFAYAIVHPEQLPTRPFLVAGRSPYALEGRRDLVLDAVTLDSVDAALAGVLQLEGSFSTQPTLTRPGVVSGLRPVLETEIGQRDVARSTVLLAAAGVLGVVLTTLAQILVAAAGRRRGWLTVARARGASRPQVVAAAMGEMAVLATVGSALGAAVAHAVAPRSATGLDTTLLAAVWAGAVLCAGLIAVSEGMRAVTVSGRPNPHPGLGRWGRIGGVLLVAIAVAAVVTFRRRGVAVDAPAAEPLVVLLPIVVPLAVVYLTRWSIPSLLGRLARAGLALGPGRLVGLRRVATSPEATIGIVTVTVLALTVTALGFGVDRALAEGAVDASWVDVGAEYRIDTREQAALDAVRALPDAVVAPTGDTRINVERGGDSYGATLITADVAALQAVTAGTAADRLLPEILETTRLDGSIPVVAAQRVNGRLVRVGDRFDGIGSRAGQVFHVVETRSEAYGRTNDFLLADRGVVGEVAGVEPGFDTLAIDAPPERRDDLASIASAVDEPLRVRTDVLDEQLDDPLSRAVRRGYLVAAGFSLLLALVAMAAVAVVTARQRRREVAVLGMLGAGRRETTDAVVAELAPAALVGVVIGTIVGWLVARSYDGRFDLSAFAAGTPVSIRVDTVELLLAAVAVLLAALLVIAVLVRRIVTTKMTDILRIDGAA